MLDGAILVLDSGKGVQSQSITVDKQMKRYRVPRIAFVNKMDNPGANYERVADMLKEKLGHHPVKIQVPMGAESDFKGIIDPIIGKAFFFEGDDGEIIREEDDPRRVRRAPPKARARRSSRTSPTSTTSSPRSSSTKSRSRSTSSAPPSAARRWLSR